MSFDSEILNEKLIEAWKLRSSETSFSASLSPLIGQCRSEEEFRTIFTQQILSHVESASSSNLLQSYFKFHTRSGYINESLLIDRLLSLQLSTVVDRQIEYLLDLLIEIFQHLQINAERAVDLAKQLNALAKWLCSTLLICVEKFFLHSDDFKMNSMIEHLSNLFLLLFTKTTFYCLWLMIIKAEREQEIWRKTQEQFLVIRKRLTNEKFVIPTVFEQILFKIERLHLLEEFHQEDIELDTSIFNPIVSLLVINRLHHSSSIFALLLRFYENVSTMTNPSVIYLRFLQSTFSGYFASIYSTNSEYQQRWSAFVHFQLPRLLASTFELRFDQIRQAVENFLLYNEILLDRLNQLCEENLFHDVLRRTFQFVDEKIREKNREKIEELFSSLEKFPRTSSKHSYLFEVLHRQRSLEKNLEEIFLSPLTEENLQIFAKNLPDLIPLICALDQFYPVIYFLLSSIEINFDLIFYSLCYLTLIVDENGDDFGQFNWNFDRHSPASFVYIWLKKYWLSRSMGHALFGSSLNSTDFLSNKSKLIENFSRTIFHLDRIESLALEKNQNEFQQLKGISGASLVHVLLWLIANYQIASENDRLWIRERIHLLTEENNSINSSLFDAIKRQLWSDMIDNRLLPFYSIINSSSPTSFVGHCSSFSYPTSTLLIEKLFEAFLLNDFLDSEQSRALYLSSKSTPIDSTIIRLLIKSNASSGICETRRALFFLFGMILFQRRSSTRSLFDFVLPFLINQKSNEFMLEPNVYNFALILTVLLTIEIHPNFDVFPRQSSLKIDRQFDDQSVLDSYWKFVDYSSNELFSSETLRPVNYFLQWFQTILWNFSRSVKNLRALIKPKFIAQLSEYLPLQCPVEKVLSILQFSHPIEVEYASMVIVRDFSRLKTLTRRTRTTLIRNNSSQFHFSSDRFNRNLTENIFYIPNDL